PDQNPEHHTRLLSKLMTPGVPKSLTHSGLGGGARRVVILDFDDAGALLADQPAPLVAGVPAGLRRSGSSASQRLIALLALGHECRAPGGAAEALGLCVRERAARHAPRDGYLLNHRYCGRDF